MEEVPRFPQGMYPQTLVDVPSSRSLKVELKRGTTFGIRRLYPPLRLKDKAPGQGASV